MLLLVPALIALVIGYVIPTVRTFWASLHEPNPLTGSSRWVGLDNYDRVVTDEGFASVGFALSIALLIALVLLLVAPLLSLAASHAGRAARLVVRLALAVPMVCFVPVGLAIAWRLDRFTFSVTDPEGSAASGVRAAVWLGMFGLICGLGVTFYLAAFRRDPRGPRWPWAAAAAVAGLALVSALAIGLQTYTFPMILTGGGPANATATPMLDAFRSGVQVLDFGAGHAVASLLLLAVMALGLAAALVVILTGMRIELAPGPERPGRWGGLRVVAVVGTALLLAGVLAVTVYGLWPWLARLGFGPPGDTPIPTSIPATLARTWLPPIVSTVVGVGLAAVAGFGIGALRPLGRASEVLLLPFAPWLFVAIGPLFLTKYESATFGTFERVDTVAGFIPPVWLVVPALFLFTLLFRGLARQEGQAPAGRSSYGRMVVTALPMGALVAGATWLVQSQSLLWGLMVSLDPDSWPAPVQAVNWAQQFSVSGEELGFGLLLPVPLLVVLALALALVHILYLERLAIRVGRSGYAGHG